MGHPLVDVVTFRLAGGHRVRIRFSDGAVRTRDLGPLLWGRVFDAIRENPAVFATLPMDRELGVLVRPNGADLDAELLRYDDLWEQKMAEKADADRHQRQGE